MQPAKEAVARQAQDAVDGQFLITQVEQQSVRLRVVVVERAQRAQV